MLRRMSMMAAAFLVSATLPTSGAMADDDSFSIEEELFFSEDEMVTSVSKKKQKLSEAAAAVYVITQDDIRRSGATSIPEALRMVPGLQVARLDANKWAVSSRGFNGRFANKLLVLIDGRSVYSPLFSGVYWDVQDTLLEDVDRIEVIRGPGATLWGANAVNGVINIITKNAEDTQGGLLTAGGGNEERGFGQVRYGGKIGEDAYYRAYAKYFDRDAGAHGADDWHVGRVGFRADWNVNEMDALTFQGDYSDGESGERSTYPILSPPFSDTVEDDSPFSGGNILFRWERQFSEASDLALQTYYDRTERATTFVAQKHDTFDLDFQHRFRPMEGQEIVWGLGYQFIADEIVGSWTLAVDNEHQEDHLLSAFVQDEMSFMEDRLRVTVGSKFEHNDYTGFEFQPSGRVLWTPRERDTVWAAVSRAVRTPSRIETAEDGGRINLRAFPGLGGVTTLASLFANSDMESEELLGYELGYRTRVTDRLTLDIAGFYNQYDDLRTLDLETPYMEDTPAPSHILIPFRVGNKMDGETYGVELAAEWKVLKWWRLDAAYTYLQMELHVDADSGDILSEAAEGQSPHNQFSLRSSMDLPSNLEFDSWLRYVDNLPDLDVNSYVTLDVRLGWKPRENIELFVVGQNLIDSEHREFGPRFLETQATSVERGVYAGLTWRF